MDQITTHHISKEVSKLGGFDGLGYNTSHSKEVSKLGGFDGLDYNTSH